MSTYRLFNRHWLIPSAICLFVDVLLLFAAFRLAYTVRFLSGSPFFTTWLWLRATVFVGVFAANLYINGLYDLKNLRGRISLLMTLGRAFAVSAFILWALYYATYGWVTPGRGVFSIALPLSFMLITAWRLVFGAMLHGQYFAERILIVGSENAAIEIAREALVRRHLGLQVVGFVSDDPRVQGKSLINPSVLGTIGNVATLAREHRVQRVVVAQQDRRGKIDLDGLLECKTTGIVVEEGVDYYEKLTGKILLETLSLRSQLVFAKGFTVSQRALAVKRLSDCAIASVGLLLASPVMLLVGLAIRLDSPGPVLFRQSRVGRFGREFNVVKFRSMRTDAEADGSPRWAQAEDPRVTRVGRWIRKTRLDELPQLWNVLKGEMSLVGPRPERKCFVEQLNQINSLYRLRLVVRPGLTGWAQTQAPYAGTVEESIDKLKYDLYYIKNLSYFLDLSILASTARTVLLRRGAR